jgi:CubicO group peptidase (beta-lactamase class C family)
MVAANSGYVFLALVIEAVSGRSYYDIVQERVCAPAGMHATSSLSIDGSRESWWSSVASSG